MNQERDLARTHIAPSAPTYDDDLAPGRGSRSSQMDAFPSPLIGGLLQCKERDANGVAEDANEAVASAASCVGSPLPESIMRKFESSLGTDLSSVRVHTGSESQMAAKSVGAKAYTLGQDIHFGAGQYDASSNAGLNLLAHEVAHTVQQRGGSPMRQNRLVVSAPADYAEREADRAADAMVSGGPAWVTNASGQIHRGIFDTPQPDQQQNPLFASPTSGPQVLGVQPIQGPNLGAPNADINGVPYDIPSGSPQNGVNSSSIPPLTAEMPPASIGDPGPIPDWQTIAPAQTVGIGPFQQTTPARPYIVHGALHSQMAKDAWSAYGQYLKDVASAWENGTAPKINTYTQQAHSDPELDKLVADSKSDYGMSVEKGKGTIADQGGAQHVSDSSSVDNSVQGVKDGGKTLLDGAKASATSPNTTAPVKTKVERVNAEKKAALAQIQLLAATDTELTGAKTTLDGANGITAQIDADAKSPDKKDAAAKAKELGDKINPMIGDLAALVVRCKEPVEQLKKIGEGTAKLLEDDPRGVIDVATGVVKLMDWAALQKRADEVALLASESPYYKLVQGAAETCTGIAKRALAIKLALEAAIQNEKVAYDELTVELEKPGNWKGQRPEDGKRAADALKAIPIVDRIVKMLRDIQGALPKVPSPSTRAAQGYTLATQGINAPGAADLHRVLTWMSSAPKILDGEATHFEEMRKSLMAVANAMGIK